MNRKTGIRRAGQLLPLLVLYVLLDSDGLLISLALQYGEAGRRVLYWQLLMQAAIYYSWGYWLFPRFLYRFRWLPLLAIVAGTAGLTYLGNYFSLLHLHQTAGFPANHKPDLLPVTAYTREMWSLVQENGPLGVFRKIQLFVWNFLLTFQYPLALLVFKELHESMQNRVRNAELQQQNTRLELDYLRSQINPHFLFNVLNSIYALTEEESPRAAQLVSQLSGMMRYTLYETNGPLVPLTSELAFVSDYVALEQTRAARRLTLDLHLPEPVDERLRIAPFILITFIENAFKHGVESTARKSWVRIGVDLNGPRLTLEVANSKPPQPAAVTGGLGLANVRKRLAHLYPDHTLVVTDDPGQYSVRLTLPLSRSDEPATRPAENRISA